MSNISTILVGGDKTLGSQTGVLGPTQLRWYGISISLDSVANLPNDANIFVSQDIHIIDISSTVIQTYGSLITVLNSHPNNTTSLNATSTPTVKVEFSLIDGNLVATARTSDNIRINVLTPDGFAQTTTHLTLDSGDAFDLFTALAGFSDIV